MVFFPLSVFPRFKKDEDPCFWGGGCASILGCASIIRYTGDTTQNKDSSEVMYTILQLLNTECGMFPVARGAASLNPHSTYPVKLQKPSCGHSATTSAKYLFVMCLLLIPEVASLTVRGSCQQVHVIGLEGVGHHGFYPVLGGYLSQVQGVVNVGRGGPGATLIRQGIRETNYSKVHAGAKKLSETCSRKGKTCVAFGGGSYPNSRSPFTSRLKSEKRWHQKHWPYLIEHGHPLHISKWYDAMSTVCDVRLVLLHRNLVESVWTHKTWDTGIQGHSEVITMFAKFIDLMLHEVPSSSWIRINYEDFWSSRIDEALTKLFSFLGWEADVEVHEIRQQVGFRYNSSKPIPPCSVVKRLDSIQDISLNSLPRYSDPSKHVLGNALSTFYRDSPRASPCRTFTRKL